MTFALKQLYHSQGDFAAGKKPKKKNARLMWQATFCCDATASSAAVQCISTGKALVYTSAQTVHAQCRLRTHVIA